MMMMNPQIVSSTCFTFFGLQSFIITLNCQTCNFTILVYSHHSVSAEYTLCSVHCNYEITLRLAKFMLNTYSFHTTIINVE